MRYSSPYSCYLLPYFVPPLVTMRKMKFQPINAKTNAILSILNISIKNQRKSQQKNHLNTH